MGYNQTYKLLYKKGKHKQNEKTTHRLGENICKWCDWEGTSLQNLQIAHETYNQNTQPNQKMGRRLKQTFLQRRHTDGQEAHENVFNNPNY